jgi:hypothetical protein
MGVKMIYFALNNDGLMCNLGDYGDHEAAQATADDLRIDVIWLFSEDEAINAANFIQHEIEDQDFCIYGE